MKIKSPVVAAKEEEYEERSQQSSRQDSKQNSNKMVTLDKRKIILIAAVVIATLVTIYLIVTGIRHNITSGRDEGKVIATQTTIQSNDPAAQVNPLYDDASKEQLIQTINEKQTIVNKLQDELNTLKNAPAKEAVIPGAPVGVQSMSEWKSTNPNVLGADTTETVKDFAPYTKKYVKLNDNTFEFFLLINYGGQDYAMSIPYSSSTILKDVGVIPIIVEYAVTKTSTDGSTPDTKVTAYVGIDPEWQSRLDLNQ